METWALLIVITLGYIACFLAGLFFAKYKYSAGGLAENTAILSDLTDRIKDTEQRVGEASELAGAIKDRIDDLDAASGDIEDIFLKYARESEERAKQEQDT